MRITTVDILKLVSGDIKDKQEVLYKIDIINGYLAEVLELFEEYFQTDDLLKIQEAIELSNIAIPDVEEEE